MIIEQGRIIRISGPDAWVSCQSRIDCARCAQGKGCGGGLLGRLIGDRLHELKVPRLNGLTKGDFVTVGISERSLLSAATLVYLLPLVFLFAGALAGQRLGGDLLAAGIGLSSMASSFWLLRHWVGRGGSGYFRPVIIDAGQAP